MARQFLNLDTLKDFDAGKAAAAFQAALKRAVADCLDRPGDKTARTVVLTTDVTPILQQDGDVIDANVEFRVTVKLPAWRTAARPVGITKTGTAYFQDLAPDNPHQTTIDEA